MITALVTGIGGTRSIAVMNALRKSDPSIRIIGTDANYFNAGSYQCDIAYTVHLASDASYLDELTKIIQTEKVSAVFATVEKEVSFLAKHKEQIERSLNVAVIVPDITVLDVCFDKYKTQEFLQKNGFTYIPCIYANNREEMKAFAREHKLPLIRKPVFGYGSRGLSVVHTEEELLALEPDSSYVLQKYIENDDTESFYNTTLNEYTAEVFVNLDSSIAGGIIIKRALHAGETVAGYLVQDAKVLAYLVEIAKKLDIKGPCNFQYRKSGRDVYIFEINPLFSGTTAIRANLGFNGVGLAVSSFIEKKHVTISPESLKQQYFIRYLQESYIDPKDMETLKNERKISRH